MKISRLFLAAAWMFCSALYGYRFFLETSTQAFEQASRDPLFTPPYALSGYLAEAPQNLVYVTIVGGLIRSVSTQRPTQIPLIETDALIYPGFTDLLNNRSSKDCALSTWAELQSFAGGNTLTKRTLCSSLPGAVSFEQDVTISSLAGLVLFKNLKGEVKSTPEITAWVKKAKTTEKSLNQAVALTLGLQVSQKKDLSPESYDQLSEELYAELVKKYSPSESRTLISQLRVWLYGADGRSGYLHLSASEGDEKFLRFGMQNVNRSLELKQRRYIDEVLLKKDKILDLFKNGKKIMIVWSLADDLFLAKESLNLADVNFEQATLTLSAGSGYPAKHMLDVLKVARLWEAKKTSDLEILRLAFGQNQISVGKTANLVLFNKQLLPIFRSSAEALLQAQQEHVMMTVVQGEIVYGDPLLMQIVSRAFNDSQNPEVIPASGINLRCPQQKAFRMPRLPGLIDKTAQALFRKYNIRPTLLNCEDPALQQKILLSLVGEAQKK